MDDVARESGVSIMTVSRVMNGSQLVSENTREKVLAVANELGYQPNLLARSLATKRTNTIGVLVTQTNNPIYNIFSTAVLNEAEKYGYDVMLSSADHIDGAIRAVNNLLGKKIDGLIVFPVEFSRESNSFHEFVDRTNEIEMFYKKLEAYLLEYGQDDFPVVILGNKGTLKDKSHVEIDYKNSGELAIDYLASKGHSKIAYIRHEVGDVSLWGQRLQGFYEGMEKHDLFVNPDWIVSSLDTAEAGYRAMKKLLVNSKELPTAVSCANDIIATGAVHAIRELGYRIPEDISVIGNDGSYVSDIVVPRLTTVSINPIVAGRSCVTLIREGIRKVGKASSVDILPVIKEGKSVLDLK